MLNGIVNKHFRVTLFVAFFSLLPVVAAITRIPNGYTLSGLLGFTTLLPIVLIACSGAGLILFIIAIGNGMLRRKTSQLVYYRSCGSFFLSGIALVLWVSCHSEAYCFWYPSIDTQYSKNYSEAAFRALRIGMSKEQVIEKL